MSFAYALINQRTAVNELILVDINEQDAEGEAMDLRDCLSLSPGTLKIRSSTYAAAAEMDLIVITAGAPQAPGESRLDLLGQTTATSISAGNAHTCAVADDSEGIGHVYCWGINVLLAD